MSRTAMEHSGHAQVSTLPVALVLRQAGRAEWTAEIDGKKIEERKFETERWYQFEVFAFQNILKDCLYLFLIQHGFFKNNGEHKTSTTL